MGRKKGDNTKDKMKTKKNKDERKGSERERLIIIFQNRGKDPCARREIQRARERERERNGLKDACFLTGMTCSRKIK